ncbi:MAG: hypothetical protein KGL52_15260 [Rhodospirillales bacterium]|nr:hypothetical protein [Rhodospirillales bacterium]
MVDTVRFRWAGVIAALLAIAVPAARAAGAPPVAGRAGAVHDPVAEAVGLFVQSCVHFATRPQALQHWAKHQRLMKVAPQYSETFLYGLPGLVYDASTRAGKLVLVSQDNGSCSVVVENTKGAALLKQLDAQLKAAGVAYTVTADGPDPQEKALHNRAYDASLGKRHWLMLISTVNNPAGGEAILTTNP